MIRKTTASDCNSPTFSKYQMKLIEAKRVYLAHRMVAVVAIQALAGTSPLDLLAEERRRIHAHRDGRQPRVRDQTRIKKWLAGRRSGMQHRKGHGPGI
ncbi:hypothetical protein HHI36_000152 [Cryptolaemus montrouzieri]|uniref:Uncharacterized protein n=1 Tax=Cryptolaemus montrouzieri TaxID=559131 RepID=A0ABD2P4E9_9CUCU